MNLIDAYYIEDAVVRTTGKKGFNLKMSQEEYQKLIDAYIAHLNTTNTNISITQYMKMRLGLLD
jgi:hypothetical protein